MTPRYEDARIHEAYRARGFSQLIPLHPEGKGPLIKGHHGGADTQRPITDEIRARLIAEHRGANVGLVLPPGVVGLDVDGYDDKPGGTTLAVLEGMYGPLPATWRSSARPLPSGIRLFQVPLDLPLRHVESWIIDRFGQERPGAGGRSVKASGLDIIRSDHRYAAVYPSGHAKTGRRVMWHGPGGEPVKRASGLPSVDGLPWLPEAWQDAWRAADAGEDPLWDRSCRGSGTAIAAGGRPASADAATRRLYQLADQLAGAGEGEVMCGPELANQLPFWAGGLVRFNGLDLDFAEAVMCGALDGWEFQGSSRRAVESRISAAVRDGAARAARGWTESEGVWSDDLGLPEDEAVTVPQGEVRAAPAAGTADESPAAEEAGTGEDWDDQEGPLALTWEQADVAIEAEFSRLRLAAPADLSATAIEVVEQLCRYEPVFLSEHEILTRAASCARRDGDVIDDTERLAELKLMLGRGHGDLTPVRLRDDGFAVGVGALAPTKRELNPAMSGFFSDLHLSAWLAERVLSGRVIFAEGMGWLVWDGIRWRTSTERGGHEAAAIQLVMLAGGARADRWAAELARLREQARAARKAGDKKRAGKAEEAAERAAAILKGWQNLMNLRYARTALQACGQHPRLKRDASIFDADPDVINTPTGIVDLRSGAIAPHDPKAYCTKVTRAPWKGLDHTHPALNAALAAFDGPEMVAYVQGFAGQSLTGHTPDSDEAHFMIGGGSNGKGLIWNDGLSWAMGSYAVLAPDQLLIGGDAKNGQASASPELMTLRGARLCLLDETPELATLNRQRLVKLVGQQTVTGRDLYKSFVTFTATHTMLILTNHPPRVTGLMYADRRRLVAVHHPFTFRKPGDPLAPGERRADPGLRRTLVGDLSAQAATLSWAVRGSVAWYAAGRRLPARPAAVVQTTSAWLAEHDDIERLATDRLVFEKGSHVLMSDLLDQYNLMLAEDGNETSQIKSARSFNRKFTGHDLVFTRGGLKAVEDWRASKGKMPSRPAGTDAATAPLRYTAVFGLRWKTASELNGAAESLDGDQSLWD